MEYYEKNLFQNINTIVDFFNIVIMFGIAKVY